MGVFHSVYYPETTKCYGAWLPRRRRVGCAAPRLAEVAVEQRMDDSHFLRPTPKRESPNEGLIDQENPRCLDMGQIDQL